ncbi:hypothetical protein [Isobaculum melis]|uniref:Uncharacterized protein n=1 Tax=Isobaculum melis TaxID=142588 RepID=A0A1H9PP92_9LACT|nr:hypothetical protein [Isobaculum melis]SER49619.1 hypothetical protein SAMN04488559_10130 [Isobaculum melis]
MSEEKEALKRIKDLVAQHQEDEMVEKKEEATKPTYQETMMNIMEILSEIGL